MQSASLMTDDIQLELEIGRVYSLEELGAIFDFKPFYIRTTGGMVASVRRNSLLLMTHSDDDASFDYGDYWEGKDLIYTGRGQKGDQVLAGQNRDVAENLKTLWVFEKHNSQTRRFLGRATCGGHWWEDAPDKDGNQRKVLKFRIQFQLPVPGQSSSPKNRRLPHHRSRRFDESAVPGPVTPGSPSTTPDEIAQLNEKAKAGHHALLVALSRWLEANEWTEIEEIPAAIDLWARRSNVRVIFEAKTLTADTELARTRAGLAQLLEYRYFYGDDSDHLCLVTDHPVSARKLRFLSALSIHCLWYHDGVFKLCGDLSDILSPFVPSRPI